MKARVTSWPVVLAAGVAITFAAAGCGSSSSTANNVTATPSFSPGGGSYSASQTVTISDTTPGAVLYCTTDGTPPTTSSQQCSEPTTVYNSEFLQAIAVAPGKVTSAVAAAGFTINLKAAATPIFSPSGGSYSSAQSVTITDGTSGANIYYTTDGSIPTATSKLYTGPLLISASGTLNAVAVASGYSNSGVATAGYTINPVSPPVISPISGAYSSAQTVTITDATPGAQVYYSVNDTNPTASSTPYTGAFAVSQAETISAIAILNGASSAVTSAAYGIGVFVPGPTFSPASGGTVTAGQTITIADADTNATIHYTLDGTLPTSSSPTYTAAVQLSTLGSVKVQAIAINGGSSSSVTSAIYTVIAAQIPAPTFSPASGATLVANGTVSVSDADSAATLYYTTDGSTPTSSSSTTLPVTLSTVGSATIKAIAIDSGTSSTVSTATYTVTAAVTPISGKVMSGTANAVNGATVQLYAAGETGYGSNATLLASATSDTSGNFSITRYSCPAAPGDLVYLVASGGDSGNGANSSLELMTALGSCASLGTNPVIINEVTTVASAYSLAQFMTTAPNVGTSSGNHVGLSNAFATVGNLADITTGTALSITPGYKNNAVAFLNTSTAPQKPVNTLANLLNACVGTDGSGCSSLWLDTNLSAAATPNTLQAILNIAQNPGAQVSNLFTLASATATFTPALGSAPNDLTLALTFTGGGFGIDPSVSGTDSAGDTGVGPTLSTTLAIDANGNVWVGGFGESGYGSGANPVIPILAEFDNQGVPQTPATTLSSDPTPVITFGGYTFGGVTLSQNRGLSSIAVDTNGNVWAADLSAGGELYVVDTGTVHQSQLPLATASLGNNVYALAIDNNSNAWLGGSGGHFYEYAYSSGVLTPSSLSPSGLSTTPTVDDLIFDSANNLWGSDYFNLAVYQIAADGTVPVTTYSGGSLQAISLAADGGGNVYGCFDAAGTTLNIFTGPPQTESTVSYTLGTRGCGEQLLLDGNNHLFAISNGFGSPTGAAIDEYTTTGTALSPTTGFTGTSSGEPATITQDSGFGFLPYFPGYTAGIDGSGNLWVINATTSNSAAPGGPSTGNVLVEFVGLAAPVTTPTAAVVTGAVEGQRP